MRLIDADEFKKQIAGMAIANNYPVDRANKFCELIDNQPTVYDVDKVVERLEVNSMYSTEDDEPFVILDDAIEIVKEGIQEMEHSAEINENIAFKLEKLVQYEELGVTPEQLKEIDAMYADRCREIAELRKQFGTVAGEEKGGQWKRHITDRFLKVK